MYKVKLTLIIIFVATVALTGMAASVSQSQKAQETKKVELAEPTDPPKETSENTFTEKEFEEFRKEYEPLLDETLDAYNEEDYAAFIKNFADEGRRARTERAFKFIWVDEYKTEYGNYVSKEFFFKKSNPSKVYPLLTYKGKFVKNDEVAVRCVYAKDPKSGKYRIFYLRYDPYKDLFYDVKFPAK